MKNPLELLAPRTWNKTVPFATKQTSPVHPLQRSDTAFDDYENVPTLFAVVSRLALSSSRVNWRLYRTATDNRRTYGPSNDSRVEVTKHPALDFLNKPNPFMPRQEFFEVGQMHVDLMGSSTLVIDRDEEYGTRFPLEGWPVRPDKLIPVPDPQNFLSGWIYLGPNGEKIPFDTDEVIQVRMPNPRDPYSGLGPTRPLRADLDSSRNAAQWSANFFRNSAEPGGIIEVPEMLGDDDYNTLKTRWNEQHQGVARAHQVAILEVGKWKDRNVSQKDMEFTDFRNLTRDIIREPFGIHKSILGQSDDVNRANAEAAEYQFSRWNIVDRLERWKGALNNEFLPMYGALGQNLEFCYDNPVPEDKEFEATERNSKVNSAVALIQTGFEPAEVLRALGLPEITFNGRQLESADEPAA